MRILLFFLLLPVFSCAQKENVVSEPPQDPLSFGLDSLNTEKCIGDNCATLRIVWPVARGQNSDQVNQTIHDEVSKYIMFGDDPTMSRDSLIAGYFGMFEEQMREFPDTPWGYEIDVEGKVSYESDSTVSIHFGWMSYMGGAHPNHGEDFVNLNAVTGAYLSQDLLIRDQEKLKAVAEQKFREFHQMADGVSLTDDGRFFLPETGFFLANAMGFDDDKFWIVYVPYEIGPYAMGDTHLEFTKQELGDIVRW
ncbi:hypothetical protein GCM10009119_36710 [Algoriphagus jejuensis]|uniref:Deacetylase PdaC domain-containing protein n=1 Tax=Algoriphagus jejuensis TaxID=419934 RepID=A0ABN1N461_9BACT